MPSFKVQCPSCEAPVLIKNPNLVGTKVECPKCKYRFKVEEPAAEAGAAKDGAAAKEKDKDKKADKKAKAAGGKNKKLVPIIAGVVALVVLVGGGIAFFGGKGNKNKGTVSNPPRSGGPGTPGGPGDTEPEGTDPKDKKPDPIVPPVPTSDKVTTNLLPGQAVAVYRLNLDLLRGSPAYGALIDQPVSAMFQETFGFTPDDITAYVHCFAGAGRDPFGVVKLKNPAKAADLLAKMPLKAGPKTVKNRALHEFRSAPVLHAIGHALAMRSVFGDLYATLPAPSAAPPKDKPYGVCVYDTQHVLVGDYALLAQFLNDLGDNGYPPIKSELDVTAVAPTPAPMTPGMPEPTPVPAPKEEPKVPAKVPAPGSGVQSYTQIDAYRTIDPELKIALDDLEADRAAPPLLVYAEKFDARQYDPKLMKKEFSGLAATLEPVASRLQFASGNVTAFGFRNLAANLRLTFTDKDFARDLAREKLAPGLATATELLKFVLVTPIDFRDYTAPGATLPGTGTPGYPGTGIPGMGIPGMGAPGMGSPGGTGAVRPPPGVAGGIVGEGLEGGARSGPPGPVSPPGPMGSGPMGSGPMGSGGVGPNGEPLAPPPSHIDLFHRDRQLLITVDLAWTDTVFRTVVAPRLVGVANQIKGKMAVFSSESSHHTLAAVAPKALNAPKGSPRGALDRAKTDPARLGLEYPPIQRVSLFAELLPYLGRGGLAAQVNRNLAWYDEKNLPAGGAWVPELLVPSYPQSAWRAHSEYAPDHTFGATNYVAISGTGMDSARENPATADPETKKKLGITGYGWGSTAADVTDGLSNTIYLMQTPPTTLPQPWIAGGGATVRGFNEDDPMSGFRHANGGKPGTYALMGDGSVRFVPANIDKKVLLALGTRAGGDGADLAEANFAAPLVDPPKPAKPAEPKKGPDPAVKSDPGAKPEPAPPPREKK